MSNNFNFEADIAAKKILVTREFNAPVEKVWRAYTEPELLAKWIAPKPWTIEKHTLELVIGGVSKYAMVSPEGQVHWMYDEFTAIDPGKAIATMGVFCDADGNPNLEGPKSYTETKFIPIDSNRSRVEAIHLFDSEETIKWFVEGGFKEGTAFAFAQLDEALAAL